MLATRFGSATAHAVADVSTASDSPLQRYLRDPDGTTHAIVAHLRDWAARTAPTLAALAAAAALTVLAGLYRAHRRHQRLTAGARLVRLLPPPAVDPASAAALWSNLVGLLRPAWARLLAGQPHLVWEYLFDHDTLRIQLWVPGPIPPGMVERAVQAAWPGVHTHTVPATPPLPTPDPAAQRRTLRRSRPAAVTAGGQLRLARGEALPIRTDFPTDPIRALLAAPAGLGPGEHAAVQILARPVTGRRVRKARRAAHRTRPGAPAKPLAAVALDLLTPGHHHTRTTRTPARSADRRAALEASAADRAAAAKHRGPQYETRIRYAATATASPGPGTGTGQPHRDAARQRMRGTAHAIASAFATFSEHNYYRRTRLRDPLTAAARRRLRRGDLLSIPELAALAHLPHDPAIPGLQQAGARAVPPPPGIPGTGEAAKPLGRSDTGTPRPVALRTADARHHLHILGATGSGKSELMAQMILSDIRAGRGVIVIDPKGDLVDDLLARTPAEAGSKVILFDAGASTRPPTLNPLHGADTASTVDNLVSIFSRIYAASWGPRTDDILRAGLLTLRAMPGTPTLTDLPKLLATPAYRQRALAHIHDDVLAGFWLWYDQLSDATRAQATAPLMNKLRGFLLRPFVRHAIAAGPSTVDMTGVLDGGILLARLAKNALGTDTARLLGSIIVAHAWQATTNRARLPQTARHDAALYLDECHNFLNLPYPLEDMLAEARAFRLSIVLAHQYLAQLPGDLAEGISTNARSKIIFTASPEDARRLARHTHPRLSEHDLANLGRFHAAARLVVNGQEAPAFTLTTDKLPPAVPGRAQQIRRAAARNTTPPPAPHRPADRQPRPANDPRRAA